MSTNSKVRAIISKEFNYEFEMAVKDYPILVLALITIGPKSVKSLVNEEIKAVFSPDYVRRLLRGFIDQAKADEMNFRFLHCLEQLEKDIMIQANDPNIPPGTDTAERNFTECMHPGKPPF